MRKYTKAERITRVLYRWKKQYLPKQSEGWYDLTKKAIYEELQKIDPLTEEACKKIIGNDSWTSLECEECERDVDKVIYFADNRYCKECLQMALKLLNTR